MYWKHMWQQREKWLYILICLICAGVIVLSALWTRHGDRASMASAPVQGEGEAFSLIRPCKGDVVRFFSVTPVAMEHGLYAAHTGVDFATSPGENVYAMADGAVIAAKDGMVHIDHGEWTGEYRGLMEIGCVTGDRVAQGDVIGTAGSRVPLEGAGILCVRLLEGDRAVDFEGLLP